MSLPGGPVTAAIYTVFLWWFATGGLFWLYGRAGLGRRQVLIIASAAAPVFAFLVHLSARTASPTSALLAFTAALGLWGWNELSFLLGFVTGPNAEVCPPGARGVDRFRRAASTLIFHEAALLGTLALIVVLVGKGPNPVAAWTFATLFAARLCAKFNLFVGVPNFSAGLFPERLRHMASYLRRRPPGGLLELSLAGLALIAGLEAGEAFARDADPFRATAFGLLFALTAMALLEHLFMLIPISESALWGWALPQAARPGPNARMSEINPSSNSGL